MNNKDNEKRIISTKNGLVDYDTIPDDIKKRAIDKAVSSVFCDIDSVVDIDIKPKRNRKR